MKKGRAIGLPLRDLVLSSPELVDRLLAAQFEAMPQEAREALRQEIELWDEASGDGLDKIDEEG